MLAAVAPALRAQLAAHALATPLWLYATRQTPRPARVRRRRGWLVWRWRHRHARDRRHARARSHLANVGDGGLDGSSALVAHIVASPLTGMAIDRIHAFSVALLAVQRSF
ncbi:hypothetical protein AKJ09_08519 [Labilithrix luteola]|uniref:Uncharacterized protein n=2 Tax=Labilithrix luteola TaxID=1391654 RepID=A0A0K1Q7R2_9BACT|nr:hypothetical protein AKJ09_08519 [Labilithrix luteola]